LRLFLTRLAIDLTVPLHPAFLTGRREFLGKPDHSSGCLPRFFIVFPLVLSISWFLVVPLLQRINQFFGQLDELS
jgi:hypothetical protein